MPTTRKSSPRRWSHRATPSKGSPLQSAMSMLNFYLNRAGRGLPAKEKRVLTRAKSELRKAFGRSDF